MRPFSFKIIAPLLFLCSISFGQTKNIYKKSFPTNKATVLSLSSTNSPVVFRVSQDNNIYVDFNLHFQNYTKKEMKEVEDQISINTRTQNNIIDLDVFSSKKLAHEQYTLKANETFVLNYDDVHIEGKRANRHITKESMIKKIKNPLGSEGGLFEKMKILQEDGTKRDIDEKSIQLMRTELVIRVPKQVYLRLKGRDAEVFLEDNMTQKMDIDLRKGLFRAKEISNSESVINIEDMNNVEVESIQAKILSLVDITRGLLGSIHRTNCMFKGSKIELGLVGRNLEIRDFSSKIYLYNFDEKFEKLKFKGEHTELFFYDIEGKVGMTAKGNTTFITKEIKTNKTLSEFEVAVLVKSVEKEKVPFGQMDINLESGIIYLMIEEE